jgi:hypothetical protein
MKQEKKVIPIDEKLHKDLKVYCKEHGYIIKSLVEKLIKQELNKNGSSISTQEKRQQ